MRNLPCAWVLTAVLAAVLPGVLWPSDRWLSLLLPVLLTGAGWYFLGTRAAFFQIALPAFAGLCALFYNLHFHQEDALSDLFHSRMTAGIEAEIRIDDPSIYNDGKEVSSYRRIQGRLTAVRFSASDDWIPADSPVIAVFPPETRGLSYGRIFRVRGVLQRPEPAILPESFAYAEYLQRRGIHFTLLVRDASPTGESSSWYGHLLAVRNRLLHSLTAALKDPEERALTAALLFGCRREMGRETRSFFIRSGTVHLLTVSGLHIGMFAAAVFLLLLPAPFRLRMFLTPVLTLFYAFSTGMQMPAVRAVLMLFCWCVPRAFLLRSSGLNSVLLAGSLLLLWNPFQLKDAGFQYSFLCVFFLVMTASRTSEWLWLMVEKRHWIPDKKQTRGKRLLVRLLIGTGSAAAGCLTAGLCSLVLTVFYQGLVVPLALPANLLLIPAVYLIFILFTAAIVPCLIFPVLGGLFSRLMAIPLGVMEPVCRYFAELSNDRVPVPPLWSVFCGIAALGLLLGFSRSKAGIIGLCGLTGLLFFWCPGLYRMPKSELVLLYGGRQRIPALVMSCPADDFSLAANLSDYRCAAAAAAYLKHRGHSDLTVLVSTGTAKEYTYGTQYVPRLIKTRHYLSETPSRRLGTAFRAGETAEKHGVRIHRQSGKRLEWLSGGQKIKTFAENRQFSFDIWQNEHKVQVCMRMDANAGTEVRISEDDGRVRSWFLPLERNPGAVRVKLNLGKADDSP